MNDIQKPEKSILYLVKGDQFGGAEKIVLDLTLWFKKYYKNLFVLSSHPYIEKICTENNISHLLVAANTFHSPIEYFKLLLRLYSFFSYNRIDVVHSFHRIFFPIITLLKIKYKFQIVYTAVNIFKDLKGYFIKADFYTALSKEILTNLIKYYKISSNKVTLIYHGINKKAQECQNVFVQSNSSLLVIGYAGRLVEEKGLRIFLNSLRYVNFNKYKVIIKGAGVEESYIKNFISTNNLDNFVSLEGWGFSLEKFWKDIHILILPSIYEEGLGIIILEAMANRKVVIASNIGAIPEIIINGFNGYLVEPNSPEAIANIINSIYYHGLPEKIIENALITAEKFCLKNVMKDYYDFYKTRDLI